MQPRHDKIAVAAAAAAFAAVCWFVYRRRLRLASAARLRVACATIPSSVEHTPILLSDSVVLPADAGKKLAGCRAVPVSAILPAKASSLTGACGVFSASDGLTTDPIPYLQLVQGFVAHSTADGSPLPVALGGPLRVWYPRGVAEQKSRCGGEGPVNVKGAVSLDVWSVEGAVTVIFNSSSADAKALILERGPTAPWKPLTWNLPGGGVDPGETSLEAAVREAQEEVNLTPLRPAFLGDFETEESVPPSLERIAAFATTATSGAFELNYESSAHAWIDEAQIEDYVFCEVCVPNVLRAAFAWHRTTRNS